MRYGLFPGCNMPTIRPDVERAIRLTMPKLGVELVDLPGYVCCPAFGTFPSLDEDGYLALSAWNLSLGEAQDVDLLVECGSCYSSLKTGRHLINDHPERKERVDELLAKADKEYKGQANVRHISDVLSNQIGTDAIKGSITKSLEGLHGVIQYPCHSLFPSKIVGFEGEPAKPHGLADLVEALGATVDHFSMEYLCCGGAGGFHRSSKNEAQGFVKKKLDAIKTETKADFIAVSCITCLMFLDSVQHELSDGSGEYAIPVFDYNQLLALCMGFPANEVAAISHVPRDSITSRF